MSILPRPVKNRMIFLSPGIPISNGKYPGQLAYDYSGGSWYFWNNTTLTWDVVGGGGVTPNLQQVCDVGSIAGYNTITWPNDYNDTKLLIDHPSTTIQPIFDITTAANSIGIKITSNSTFTTATMVYLNNNGQGYGLSIESTSTKPSVRIITNGTGDSATTSAGIFIFKNQDSSSGIYIENSGSGYGLYIHNTAGSYSDYAQYLDLTNNGSGIHINNSGSSGWHLLDLYHYRNTTGIAFYNYSNNVGIGINHYGGGKGVSINTRNGDALYIRNDGTQNGINIFNVHSTAQNGIYINNYSTSYAGIYLTTGADTITSIELNRGRIKANTSSNRAFGLATITTGNSSITVSNTLITSNSIIFLTIQDGDNTVIPQATNKIDSTSFDIVLSGAVSSDTDIAYMIVN